MKNMFRIIVMIGIVILFAGCSFFAIGSTDSGSEGALEKEAEVTLVEVEDNGPKDLESVTITFTSTGSAVPAVEYAILLSNGSSLSYYSDVVIYEGTVDLPQNDTVIEVVLRAAIDTYMTDNSESASDGSYYVGVLLDPQDLSLPDVSAYAKQAVTSTEYTFTN